MYLNNGFPSNLQSLQGLRMLVVDNNIDSCDLENQLCPAVAS